MAKKNKIERGQCYSYHDRIFMVVDRGGPGYWVIQDTLTKENFTFHEIEFSFWRRPFDNCG